MQITASTVSPTRRHAADHRRRPRDSPGRRRHRLPERRHSLSHEQVRTVTAGALEVTLGGRKASTRKVSTPKVSAQMHPTFVLVRGAFANSFSFAPLQAELGLLGHRSVAVDLPGHGFQATFTRAYRSPQDPEGLATAPGSTKGGLATLPAPSARA
ncbi:hypothetical protein SAMN05428939_4010 [Streptomyces sp. TLI_105]|nr:hypothetical protein SAMN05428939_4010 [Streptomyces sp. TLI_105]